jgi:nitroimidazol reductase NimA-like FMN-containing flavoprotein (pyridoxamine 5'-phosphate oxidase superfamily)
MVDPRPGRIEILSDGECVKLLKAHDLGRIAVVDRQGHPLIFPINYFFDEGVVVFRTAPGTKLDLAPGVYVSFEIDGLDPHRGVGWSVLVKGIAHDITQPRGAPTARMRYWPVHPAAPGSREHWVGIWANEITGRKFRSDARRPAS